VWRYSAAMAAMRTTASGSSALTWKMGMGRRLARSEAKREELDSSGQRGEAEQVVDDDLDGAADVVAVQRGEVEGLGEMPWPAKAASPWMMMGRPARGPSFAAREALLLGAGAAHDDGVDGFEMAGVGGEMQMTVLPVAVVKSPVAPMWYFTSPPPMVLRGSTSSNLVKISGAAADGVDHDVEAAAMAHGEDGAVDA
jgi:hypothetical protein